MDLKYQLLWRTIACLVLAALGLVFLAWAFWVGIVRSEWAHGAFYLLLVQFVDQLRQSYKDENANILKQMKFERDYGMRQL